jgi:hypothetical protein
MRKAVALTDLVLESVANGAKRMVLYGVSRTLFEVRAALAEAAVDDLVVGIVDHRPPQQGRPLGRFVVASPRDLRVLAPDLVVVTVDADWSAALQVLATASAMSFRVLLPGDAHLYAYDDAVYSELTKQPLVRSHAQGYPLMQIHLYEALKYITARGLVGHVAEFGVYKGGTTMFLAQTLERLGHPGHVYGFDTFAGFPRSGHVLDLHDSAEDEFRDSSAVKAWLGTNSRIVLIEGDIRETYRRLTSVPLVLTFFDTDNYTGTRAALELCYEQTVTGGVLAFDHYYSPSWPSTFGEKLAADEVLRDAAVFHLHGTGIFVKWG